MSPALSNATLAGLRRPRPYPAVSILMPTHRRERDNAQDPIRLRNLVTEAKDRIQADPAVSRADRMDIFGQIDQALEQIDPYYAEEGLALFVAPGEHQVWTLDRTVPARVVISDTFLTRNLVAMQAADQRYWVMAVSADHVTLWNGERERAVQEKSGAFPLARSLEDPDSERKERIGDLPSTFTDELTRQFLREADAALVAVLATEPRPVYVVGEAQALALLDDVGTAVKGAVARVTLGGLAQGPAEAVWQAVQPALAAHAAEEVAAVEQELEKAVGRKDFAAGIDEVWQKVSAGRIALLAVEDDYRTTVRDDGDHLVPAESGEVGARDDIVDEVVEHALDTGARVRFVPNDTLAGSGRIAAVLRY